ncbi:Two-component sensor histidine kinase, contains HisKA and HATPase domains [Methylobacterium sp. UNC378MF]|uniref:sensor histidine kinase n=1 Tax=Methylobacterium sp. UNC378MF TaxID=1502748 RepID=UPI00088F8908|nr:HWE histidine kinase domain-containing protein [Methylobacterium sp. UNC378MF]SDA21642.1 Two-component sensor histidine kinase, contains HisKA and HATPase domains [Methylobacterium sp. UNC378MF]
MSLTNRIVGLVALALMPALVIQGYNEYALRAARTEVVRAEAIRTARGVAADLGQFGRGVRQALRILAEVPEIHGMDPEVCTPYLRTLLDKVPGAFFFGVIGADGRVVCNTLGSARGAYSLADRRYFQDAMRAGFAVGEYVRGRITDRPTIQLAQGIPGPDGRPAGVVLASVDLDYLARQQSQAGLPADATLTVADRKGAILLRVPDQAEWVGKLLPPAYQATLQANRGQVVDMIGLRGTTRITGVAAATPDDLDGITVAVGLSPVTAFADIDAATRRGLILIGLGAALALAAALLAGRAFIREPVHRLLRTASAWRAGDLGARTGIAGPTEFGQLGEAFDAMAASLQKHEGELRAEISRSHQLQERQTMMLHELNHRVRNTLATVQSLARQSRRSDATDERLEGRILALSKTHDLLSRDDWSGASLVTVLENELSPFEGKQDERFRLDGPDIELPPRYVLALGMTLHELTTNAAKYGALSVETGRVDIAWRVATGESGARRLVIEWRETGGPPVSEPRRRGYGTRLINGGVSHELGGKVRLDFEAPGLRCTVDVPLDAQDRFTSFRDVGSPSSPSS